MGNINKRLNLLRTSMKESGIYACIIPTSDPHLSEYIHDCFKYREYFSGFDGSAGTLFVTLDKAFLITDGRYFLQAEEQLKNTDIKLVRSGVIGEPDLITLCKDNIPENEKVFIDPSLVSATFYEKISSDLNKCNVSISSTHNPVKNSAKLPSLEFSNIRELDLTLSGIDRKEKITSVREKIKEAGAESLVLSALDDIAWLFNLRGRDVENTPVFFSFAYVSLSEVFLFVDYDAVKSVEQSLEADKIEVRSYYEFADFIASIPEMRIIVDKKTTNSQIVNSLPCSAKIISDLNPIPMLKALKNNTEINNMRAAHVSDGIALLKFMRFIKESDWTSLTETEASDKLFEYRKQEKNFISNSFDTISAYAENAAIIHYSPNENTDKKLEKAAALLVDSGGQYDGGTTDVTRMFILGETSNEFKRDYTLVCKAMLRLQYMHFPLGTKGSVLDGVVREPLWKYGIDFMHGTGHGIGYMLSVHEGPNRISFKDTESKILPRMITSDEPGIYVDGQYGIRMENALICVEDNENKYGKFCKFEPLTVCPIDLDGIDESLLTQEDRNNINDYHQYVREMLKPHLSPDDANYLDRITRQI